jgi:hypothetical protein
MEWKKRPRLSFSLFGKTLNCNKLLFDEAYERLKAFGPGEMTKGKIGANYFPCCRSFSAQANIHTHGNQLFRVFFRVIYSAEEFS